MDLKFIFIGVLLVGAVIFVAIRTYSYHFECPECGKHFKINFFEYLYATGVILGKHRKATLFGDVEVTCTECGRSNFLTAQKGK